MSDDNLSTAPQPSRVTLPVRDPAPALLDFLCERFPRIRREVWRERFAAGKVLDEGGAPLAEGAQYRAGARIQYFREVAAEPRVPFEEEILLQTDDLLVADKPHFLPVAPGGKYVNECLLYRLQAKTGIAELAPLHRLDLDTAGLVLFSTRKETRGLFGKLFQEGAIERTYLAVAGAADGGEPEHRRWRVESRIERGEAWFRCRSVAPRIVASGGTEAALTTDGTDGTSPREGAASIAGTAGTAGIRAAEGAERAEGAEDARGTEAAPTTEAAPATESTDAPPNARTEIELLAWSRQTGRGLFRLRPETGKTHQLRLHMTDLGLPIVHDPLYPEPLPKGERDQERPMQLLAAELAFGDPLTGVRRELRSRRELSLAGSLG